MAPGSVRASESGFRPARGRSRTSFDRKLPPRAGSGLDHGAPPSTVTLSATEPTSIEKFREITSCTCSSTSGLTMVRKANFAHDHSIGSRRKVRNVVEAFLVGFGREDDVGFMLVASTFTAGNDLAARIGHTASERCRRARQEGEAGCEQQEEWHIAAFRHHAFDLRMFLRQSMPSGLPFCTNQSSMDDSGSP